MPFLEYNIFKAEDTELYFGFCSDFIDDLEKFCKERNFSLFIGNFQIGKTSAYFYITLKNYNFFQGYDSLVFYLNLIAAKNNLKLWEIHLKYENFHPSYFDFVAYLEIILEKNVEEVLNEN